MDDPHPTRKQTTAAPTGKAVIRLDTPAPLVAAAPLLTLVRALARQAAAEAYAQVIHSTSKSEPS